MLIRFTVKNFGSFLEEQSLSMVKGKGRNLPNHVNEDETAGFKTLKGAIIYGANAAGKSNLIRAIKYAHEFIVHNNKLDIGRPFLLDDSSINEPSSFNFEFKTDNQAYSYGFEVKGNEIIKEWLYELLSDREEKLFERDAKNSSKANIDFGPSIRKKLKKNDIADLDAIARTTPDDTLFLYDAKRRNLDLFLEPLFWFERKLRVSISDGTNVIVVKDNTFLDFVNSLLKSADTGITEIVLEKNNEFNKYINLPETKELLENLDENIKVFLSTPKNRLVFSKQDGKFCTEEFITYRCDKNNKKVRFELNQESDGTKRLLDLAHFFFSRDTSDNVLVIDEMDRSLHPKITEMIHDMHFNDPKRKNAQMILATHEHYLLTQQFYRRDEIWFVEKDKYGISKIKSLSEYKIRHDKDIEKDYLLGRYGATPYIRKLNA